MITSSSSAHSSQQCSSWLSDEEWKRLYRMIRPTTMQMSEFQTHIYNATIHDVVLSAPLTKVLREARHIMEEHGWLRELQLFPKTAAKKEIMSRLLQQAILLSSSSTTSAATGAAARGGSSDVVGGGCSSNAATAVSTCSSSGLGGVNASLQNSATPRREDITVARSVTDELISSPALSRRENRPAVSAVRSSVPEPSKAAAATTLQRSVEAAAAAAMLPPKCPSALSSSLPPLTPMLAPSPSATSPEYYSSPMGKVVYLLKRFQLRMGSFPIKFEIPASYSNAVTSRKLRVQVVPMTGNTPAVWPKVKEVFVFVNERQVQTTWKRSWPVKKREVNKAYLPLDITQLLLHPLHPQRIQMDCFNHEYCGSFAVVLVQPCTESEVIESMQARCKLSSQALQPFYQAVMRPDTTSTPGIGGGDADDDDIVWDVPTVALKCPISQCRMQSPIRGRDCRHLQCMDFAAFLRYCHIACYWNCPLCDSPMRVTDVVVDAPLQQLLENPDSSRWSHAQLVRRRGESDVGEYEWGQSERHRVSAVAVSDSDEEEDMQRDDERDKKRRRLEDEVKATAEGSPEGIGSAEEPFCL